MRLKRKNVALLAVAMHPDVASANVKAIRTLSPQDPVWRAVLLVAAATQNEMVRQAMMARGEERTELLACAKGAGMLLQELELARKTREVAS
jgi:hypothetical protein